MATRSKPQQALSHPSQPFYLHYAGMTGKVTAADRMRADASTTQRHYANFLPFAPNPPRTYPFRHRFRVTSVDELRTNPTVGDVEQILITALGLGLNDDAGGWFDHYEPPQVLKDVLRSTMKTVGKLPAVDASLPPPLHDRITSVLHESRTFWQTKRDGGVEVGEKILDKAFTASLNAALAVPTVNGIAIMKTLADDTPQEQYRGSVVGPWAANAGRALMMERKFLSLLYDEVGIVGDLPLETVRRVYGGFTDIFSTCLPNSLWSEAVAFASKYIVAVKPLVITTWSSLNAHLVWIQDGLNSVWADDYQDLDIGRVKQIDKREMNARDFLDQIGRCGIIRTGPSENDVALCISRPHPGGLKYDPELAKPRRHLHFLAFCAEQLLATVARKYAGTISTQELESDRLNHLQRIRDEFVHHSEASGLADMLEENKKRLLGVQTPLSSLRRLDKGGKGPTRAGFSRTGLRAAPLGPQREMQMRELEEDYYGRKLRGAPPNPHNVLPWGMEMGSPEWRKWFGSLKDGALITQAVNGYGTTQEGVQATMRNRASSRQKGRLAQSLIHQRARELAIGPLNEQVSRASCGMQWLKLEKSFAISQV
ncbi:hypothetical protein IAR55_004489 [Kwoniella newhampshirensis]|uniref:Uncharacterized protein n=1 Tax=Kwoniella newhampshirensis TaxID=1651941 RepID=A0AAW0YPN5_9TREE